MSQFRDSGEGIARLRDRMNLLFNDFFTGIEQQEMLDEVKWAPRLDVLEDKDDIIVRVDIPGMDPDEIDLSISGEALYIKGERKREGENYHTIERGYGEFNRRVILPTSVNVDSIKASYKQGVLTVRLPKLEETKAEQIKVDL